MHSTFMSTEIVKQRNEQRIAAAAEYRLAKATATANKREPRAPRVAESAARKLRTT